MNLNAPTKPVFLIAVVLAVLAVLGTLITIPVVSASAFWVMTIAFVILCIGNLMRGA